MAEQLTRPEAKVDHTRKAEGHAERISGGDSLTNPYLQADTVSRLTGERSAAQSTVDQKFGSLQIVDSKAESKAGGKADSKSDGKADSKPAEGTERPIAPPPAPGALAIKGDKGQVVVFEGGKVREIDYPNGTKVKLQRDASGDITRADISGAGPGLDGSVVKKGDHYERFDASGKATGQIVTKVEINNDGSAVVSGEQFGFKGRQIVGTDGKVTAKIDL